MLSAKFKRNIPLHLMLLPGVILIFIYSYLPMCGITIAFQKFSPAKGLFGAQEWVGLENFYYVFSSSQSVRAIRNTLIIAVWKIVLRLLVPILFSILLNELKHNGFKRVVQTAIYLPHFISWVILSGIFIDILSPSEGILNEFLGALGMKPIFFLGSNKWFRTTIVATEIWKEFGFGTVIYLATITGIDPTLYEAAVVDGANRWKQTWHITLPGMRMIIVLLAVLSLGDVLSAGFDQVFNLYSPMVYETGDIIDTYVYRLGMMNFEYGPATAVGLGKSVISLILISSSYYLAYRFADYRIF